MPQDRLRHHASALHSPASRIERVQPDDDADLAHVTRALCAGEAGWVSVVTATGGQGEVYLAAGVPFPIRVRRVRATGTTAGGLRGLS